MKGDSTDLPALAQTAIDLIHIMIPYIPSDTYDTLWNLISPLLKRKDDPNMQKRAYRCLAKFAEVDRGREFLANRPALVEEILKRTDSHTTSQKVINCQRRLILGSNSCTPSTC